MIGTSHPDWTVRDAVLGKLVWMVPPLPEKNNAKFKFQMWRRLKKMIEKGFCVDSACPSIHGYVPAEILVPKVVGDLCGIDKVPVGEDGCVLRCGHSYHEACLAAWIGEGREDCPDCRGTPIEFTRA